MPLPKHLVFAVTNNLVYDQRMQRICTSLAGAGYKVTLVGRKQQPLAPLAPQTFHQHRLTCWLQKGKGMYIEYNLRLFFYLLALRADVLCAIDLDTIAAVWAAGRLRNRLLVYDAHELFTEQKEIVTRPAIYKIWLGVEKFFVPRFKHGYTVNGFIRNEFNRRYGVQYAVVRNMPVLTPEPPPTINNRLIIYQGAVNEGRSFETLIPAMAQVNGKLLICGQGNFYSQVQALIAQHNVRNKVELKGYVLPADLAALTPTANCAVMLFENTGLNQYHSLANRFFDYIMAGVPQLCVDYPEYRAINQQYKVAVLIPDTQTGTIAQALNNLLNDDVLLTTLRRNCLEARKHLNWQHEQKTLIDFYNTLQ